MDTSFCVDFNDEIIKNCAKFFNCKAEIIVVNELSVHTKLNDNYVFTFPRGIRGCYLFNKDAIIVRIQKTMAEMLTTLCHEIVHYQQWTKKKCFFLNNDVILFDGKKYTVSKIDYNDMPWEKEAYKKEIDYCSKFLKSLPLSLRTTIMDNLKKFGV